MPCFDPRDQRIREVPVPDKRIESALCSAFKYIERNSSFKHYLDSVDWAEQGISKQFVINWWERHKDKDRRRIQEAHAKAKLEKEKEPAAKKLTAQERKILGIDRNGHKVR